MRPGFFLTPDTWNLSMVYSRIDENITLIRDEPRHSGLDPESRFSETPETPDGGFPRGNDENG